jgi:hypothetical protein
MFQVNEGRFAPLNPLQMSCHVMRHIPMLALCALTACMPSSPAQVTKSYWQDSLTELAVPASLGAEAAPQRYKSRPNAEIAHDFLDLEFRMESGNANPHLSRFEGPISVRLQGAVPAKAPAEMAHVLDRLRKEAGLDVWLAKAGQSASIAVEFLPRAQMQKLVPMAACFTVPRVTSWAEYQAQRHSSKLDWTTVTYRTHVAIFIPSDAAPQEMRDCLNEETAQSMGPLNDLYRLPDSVFNDDNFNSVLTKFDMLMLRLHYAPELRSGMNEAEVAKHLPALLARYNPEGAHGEAHIGQIAPRIWIAEVERAFGPKGSNAQRLAASQKMLKIAFARGWDDNRLAFSYYAIGRSLAVNQPAAATNALRQAAAIYHRTPNAQIHLAHVDMQLAAIAVALGENQQAIGFASRALPVARSAENAALWATLMLLKAEALENLGQVAQARALRLDSLIWARYGFGSDQQVQARMADIAALGARGARG